MSEDTLIREASVRLCRAPLHIPFRTARGQHDILENVLFEIELRDGTKGFGEAAVAPHITGERVSQTLSNLKQAATELAGKNIAAFKQICCSYHEKFRTNPCASAAVEMAVLDAWARNKKIPLWRMFGTRRHPVRTDVTIVISDLPRAKAFTSKFYRRGFRAFKVKIGRDFDADIERAVAVKQAAPEAAIYLDANRGYSAEKSVRFVMRLRKRGIRPALIEQPVPKEDWEGLRKVAREGKITVIADESASTFSDAVRLIKRRFADGINIKLMKFGILRSSEIAKLARSRGVKLMIGQMMETALGTTAAAHFAAGTGGFRYVDLDAPLFITERVVRGNYLSRDGKYDLRPVKSGIGIEPLT